MAESVYVLVLESTRQVTVRLQLARRLQHPKSLHYVALTDHLDAQESQRALEAGADSVLDNGCLPFEL